MARVPGTSDTIKSAQGIRDEQVLNLLPPQSVKNLLMKRLNKKLDNTRSLIGQGQTPRYMVARMTEYRRADRSRGCLKIGTGLGWSAAIPAHLVQHKFVSVERSRHQCRRLKIF